MGVARARGGGPNEEEEEAPLLAWQQQQVQQVLSDFDAQVQIHFLVNKFY